jgi:hypothetical protein
MQFHEFFEIAALSDNDLLLVQEATTFAIKALKASTLKQYIGIAATPGTGSTTYQSTYVSDGDDNGVFYSLGTQKKTVAWQNPQSRQIVLTASSIGDGGVESLVNRDESSFFTGNVSDSWITIDFLPGNKFKPNFYSIKTRNTSSGFYPRTWQLEGSNNNTTWIVLDNQVNNSSLINNNQWLSLVVINSAFYQYIRLTNRGLNSSGFNHLVLGEIELYGDYATT